MSLLEGAADSSREFGLPYDLVISDIFLEGADSGLDLYEHCQQEFPEMPVLVMSGVKQCKLSGMIGSSNICPPFLQKPFRVSACREALQSFGI
jgi:DNA-binding NtrC family response regulator